MEEIVPVTHDLGDFKVRRTLPARTETMIGPFPLPEHPKTVSYP